MTMSIITKMKRGREPTIDTMMMKKKNLRVYPKVRNSLFKAVGYRILVKTGDRHNAKRTYKQEIVLMPERTNHITEKTNRLTAHMRIVRHGILSVEILGVADLFKDM